MRTLTKGTIDGEGVENLSENDLNVDDFVFDIFKKECSVGDGLIL